MFTSTTSQTMYVLLNMRKTSFDRRSYAMKAKGMKRLTVVKIVLTALQIFT